MRITKYKSIIFSLVLSSILFTGCKNALDETPKGFLTFENFYKTEEQIKYAVLGCYVPLNSIYKTGLMLSTETHSDLAFLENISQFEAVFEISPSMPGMGTDLWENCYKGVMYCNAVIDGSQNSEIEEEKKLPLMAEAMTLRALYYYILTSTFKDVPFYKEHVKNIEVLNHVSKLPRMSAVDTRNNLIEELKEYVNYLPKIKTSQIAGNRVSSSMAYMLIAKMAMWNGDYQDALDALLEIRKVYGTLSQYPLVDTYFRNKNTPESIFEVQFTWSATGLKKTSAVASNFTPSRSGFRYDGVEILELGDKANPYASIIPSNYFINLYNEIDPRRNIVLGYNYNGLMFNRPKNGGKPWMGPKFWSPGMDNVSDGNNQKVFRFADALLMIAECANELGGGDNENLALACVNEVRTRALSTLVIANYPGQISFRNFIKEERARELMGEYQRKWDLVRWGDFYEKVKGTSAQELERMNNNLRPYHEFYPIPDSEVVRSGGILDNNAYVGF